MKNGSKLGFAAALALSFTSFVPAMAAEQNVNNTTVHSPMSYYQAAYKDENSLTEIVEKAFNKDLEGFTFRKKGSTLQYVSEDTIIEIKGLDLEKEGYQAVKMAMKGESDKAASGTLTASNSLSSAKDIISVRNAVIEVRDEQAPVIEAQDTVTTYENSPVDLESLISASDNTGKVDLAIDQAVDFSKAGEYTVSISAKDQAGNTSEKTMNVIVEKDDFYDRIAQAAIAQVGTYQDCTMLVTNALKAVGIDFHGWPAEYAQLGSFTNNPVPGDIIIYSGHVALYIGNGQAVHGGWLGNQTVISTVECSNALVGYVHVAR
ncbi:NlpC/P60 family protein [uncultured Dubosiella sp.]|uniref:NlpC/P60 family protein n=2 Tax=uncultured Dubosiella sp. TaxID=1937011 RepID=UPI0026324529|nr:NlpC/P60 family protein [uncultured Dubosiella sp.]